MKITLALVLLLASIPRSGIASSALPPNTSEVLVALWHEANTVCRGSSGDDQKTHAACDAREVYGARLDTLGWCYGRRGEYGYQMRWHRCSGRSLRHGE